MYAEKDHEMEAEMSHEMRHETWPEPWRGSSLSGVPQQIVLACSGLDSQSCDGLENFSPRYTKVDISVGDAGFGLRDIVARKGMPPLVVTEFSVPWWGEGSNRVISLWATQCLSELRDLLLSGQSHWFGELVEKMHHEETVLITNARRT
ncbi:hypothetical protein INR49_030949 [Caranx melampygus]|nr:hypothetical protein INR49_030949 [Caranx melampygus]